MNVTALEAWYGGYKFRSRCEARWSIFFDRAGIAHDYEPQGFLIHGEGYLPDFYLRGPRMYLEVKGKDPTMDECRKCEAVSKATESEMLLAVGNPKEQFQIIVFDRGEQIEERYVFAHDKNPDAGFWLVADNDARPIGPRDFGVTLRGPMLTGRVAEAYLAAGAERFGSEIRYTRYSPLPWSEERLWERDDDEAADESVA